MASSQKICRVLKAKIPSCGQRVQFQSLASDHDEHDHADIADVERAGPAQQHQQQLCHDVAEALSHFLRNDNAAVPVIDHVIFDGLNVDIDTRLLLKMMYQDELSLPKAAAILGLAEHTARRQVQRAMTQFEQRLKQSGFDWNDWSSQHD